MNRLPGQRISEYRLTLCALQLPYVAKALTAAVDFQVRRWCWKEPVDFVVDGLQFSPPTHRV
jgi:hypothetical protein